jgi:hypothetical protein
LGKDKVLGMVEEYNLFACAGQNCLLVMQYDSLVIESSSILPSIPDMMVIGTSNDSPSQQTLIIRALVGSPGVQLLVNSSDRIPVSFFLF